MWAVLGKGRKRILSKQHNLPNRKAGQRGLFHEIRRWQRKNDRKKADLHCYMREIFEGAMYNLSFLCA